MEQIVKIFVHQSYFIENDLVVDYNVEQGAQINVSPKDWLALIPKGWSGVEEQVAFKTVDSDSAANLAIKSVVMEKKYFQHLVMCEKPYQLMYIGKHLEILGRSEYFVFLHQSDTCNCVSSSKKIDCTDNLKPTRLPSVFSRKPQRRQSPTPRDFYKLRPRSQNNVEKREKSKPKQLLNDKCVKCNAPYNFTALESAYLTKIQDLTITNDNMEQRLLKVEKDLVHTLDVINKQFKLNQAITEKRDDLQKFIDNIVDDLLKDGTASFWAHDQEFSIVREYPDINQLSLLDNCTTLSINKSNLSNETFMKSIIGHQEETIQYLVNKIKTSFDIFLKVNTQSSDQNISFSSSETKINNVSCINIAGTTYFSSPEYGIDTLNDFDLCLSPKINNNKMKTYESAYKWKNNSININKFPNVDSKVITTLNNKIEDKILTFEDWKKDNSDYMLRSPVCENNIEVTKESDKTKQDRHDEFDHSDESL